MLRIKSLPMTATARTPTPLPPVNDINAVLIYPDPGLSTVIDVTLPALLTTAVIVACSMHSPVTITSGATVYPMPPSTTVTL